MGSSRDRERGGDVFVYELAVELGMRSGDLVDRANALGWDLRGPTDALTPQQAHQLRAAMRPAEVPGPPPPVGAVPSPPPAAPGPAAAVTAPAPRRGGWAEVMRRRLIVAAVALPVVALSSVLINVLGGDDDGPGPRADRPAADGKPVFQQCSRLNPCGDAVERKRGPEIRLVTPGGTTAGEIAEVAQFCAAHPVFDAWVGDLVRQVATASGPVDPDLHWWIEHEVEEQRTASSQLTSSLRLDEPADTPASVFDRLDTAAGGEPDALRRAAEAVIPSARALATELDALAAAHC